jgi:hypothetical protein
MSASIGRFFFSECGCTKQALSDVDLTTSASISFLTSFKNSTDIVCLVFVRGGVLYPKLCVVVPLHPASCEPQVHEIDERLRSLRGEPRRSLQSSPHFLESVIRRSVEVKRFVGSDEDPDFIDSEEQKPDGTNLSSCSIQASSRCAL